MEFDEIAALSLGVATAPVIKGQLNNIMAPLNLDAIAPGLHKTVQAVAEGVAGLAAISMGGSNKIAKDLGYYLLAVSATTVLDPLFPSVRYAPVMAPPSAATSAQVFSVPIGSVIS